MSTTKISGEFSSQSIQFSSQEDGILHKFRHSKAGMPFIVSTGQKNDDPEMRKLIRSHVMLGKNRGKLRPSRRKEPPPWKLVPAWGVSDSPSAMFQVSQSVIPSRAGSDWSFIQFADTIEPSTIADILKYADPVSSIAKQATFQLEVCISFDKKDRTLFEPMTFDAAYLHAVALGTHTYIGLMLGHESHNAVQCTSQHFSKALRLLRERLLFGDEKVKIFDATMLVVMALAFHGRMMGDYESAKHHMEGLRKMVNLRGGIVVISHNTKLMMEISRCDMGIAIESGSRPVFFCEDSPGEPFMRFPDQISGLIPKNTSKASPQSNSERFLDNIDEKLATVWRAVKRFCLLINRAAKIKRKLPEETLLETMASVMYRLLHMSFTSGSFHAAIRLGLLVVCSHIFLQWPDIKMPNNYLSSTYRECLINLDILEEDSSQVLLWLLMVGAISVFTESDAVWLKPWLRSNIEICKVESWSELRDIMNSFIWVGLVFDDPGKDVFDSILLP